VRPLVDVPGGCPNLESTRPRARKDEILDVARRILIDEGHYRITMRNVAEQVGIKLASLQYHFRSKNDLIVALIDFGNDAQESLVESLLRVVDSSTRGESIAAIVDRVFEEYQDARFINFHDQLWALSAQNTSTMEHYLKSYSDLWDSATKAIADLNPTATAEECRTRATFIIALIEGLETFLRAESLRSQMPDSAKASLAHLIQFIAQGKTF